MLIGPVLKAELLTTSRRPRYLMLRTLFGAAIGWVLFQNLQDVWLLLAPSNEVINHLAWVTRQAVIALATIQLMILVLATPAVVAGVIAEETQRRTFHDLLTSELTSSAIVLGKIASRLLHLFVLMAIGLPIFILLNLYGGIDPTFILQVFATTASTVFCLAGFSILASVLSTRPRIAIVLCYLSLLVVNVIPTMLRGAVEYGEWPVPFKFVMLSISSLLEWLNPFQSIARVANPLRFEPLVSIVLRWVDSSTGIANPPWLGPSNQAIWDPSYQTWSNVNAFSPSQGAGFVWDFRIFLAGGLDSYIIAEAIVIHLLLGIIAVCASIALLRPAYRWRNSPGRAVKWQQNGKPISVDWLTNCRRSCGDDAMSWKERRGWRMGRGWRIVIRSLIYFSSIILFAWTFELVKPALVTLKPDAGRLAYISSELRPILMVMATLWLIGLALVASTSVTDEREQDTWDSLLATPLTAVEITRGKLIGALWVLLPLGLGQLALGALGVVCGAYHPMALLLMPMTMAATGGFAFGVGFWFSLRSKSSTRSMTGTVSFLAVACFLMIVLGNWIDRPDWDGPGQIGALFPQNLISVSVLDVNRLSVESQRARILRGETHGLLATVLDASLGAGLILAGLRRLDRVERMNSVKTLTPKRSHFGLRRA